MRKKISALLILALPLLAFTAMTAFAAESPGGGSQTPVNKSDIYPNMSGEYSGIFAPGKETPKQALGRAAPSASPGTIVGNTWYDYQRNGSMRRMIARDTTDGTRIVHFTWMRLASSTMVSRKCCYQCWDPVYGSFGCCDPGACVPIPNDQYAGYCVVDATNDDRGIVGGHNTLNSPIYPYQSQFWWDDDPCVGDFFTTCRVPDTLGDACQANPSDDGFLWPAMCWQEGEDTILHVFAQEGNPAIGQDQALTYFRAVNPEQDCIWDEEHFYCVDTVFDVAQDCDCTDGGKVAITWTANLPIPGDCDTCSSSGHWDFFQWDNDLYYQISFDGGVTWQPRVNVTKNVDGVDGYRPYTDVSALIDSRNYLHLVWNARFWPSDANYGGDAGLLKGRIFHWSEDNPTIRTVHSADWDPEYCSGGAWQLNASKMSVSECDGKLYVLFVQFNDYNVVPPVVNDCSAPGPQNSYHGRANGELYVCISNTWGNAWDQARNLTNSRTPGCTLVAEGQGNCDSDNWPSMVKFGTYDDGSGYWPDNIVDPTDSPAGYYDWYLDVQYINDNYAGAIVQGEGWWTQSDVKWFRLACVEPEPIAKLILSPISIGYDYLCWTEHGVQKDVPATVENAGNVGLNYTVTVTEYTGPSGWLTYSGFSGSTSPGETENGTVHINTDGKVNAPGTRYYLHGSLTFDSNDPISPHIMEIQCWVIDTDSILQTVWDTIHTTCLALTVSNAGCSGNRGGRTFEGDKEGKVNMDYVNAGDCDTTAKVYLYDGSLVIGYVNEDDDTIVNVSYYGKSPIEPSTFLPGDSYISATDSVKYEVFRTRKFLTDDSLIILEKRWNAPKLVGDDACSFVIECTRVYLNGAKKGEPPRHVRIGEFIDWDVPADVYGRNSSGISPYPYNLIWQRGCEEDGGGCQPDSNRWAGISFLEGYKNDSVYKTEPHGAYTKDNISYVYTLRGYDLDTLYKYLDIGGWSISDSTCIDLHTVMSFDTLAFLLPGDTYTYCVALVTHWNGDYNSFLNEVQASWEWYQYSPCRPCCNTDGIRGDVDMGGSINVGDVAWLIAYLFGTPQGPTPPCFDEADIDGSGSINVGDVAYLVDYLFGTPPGPAPAPCPPWL